MSLQQKNSIFLLLFFYNGINSHLIGIFKNVRGFRNINGIVRTARAKNREKQKNAAEI